MNLRGTSIAFAVAALLFAAACSSSPTGPGSVSSVAVIGAIPPVGGAAQLIASATLTNGTTEDVTTQATWSSSNPAIATVSSVGLVSAVAAGAVQITATFESVSGVDNLTINAAP